MVKDKDSEGATDGSTKLFFPNHESIRSGSHLIPFTSTQSNAEQRVSCMTLTSPLLMSCKDGWPWMTQLTSLQAAAFRAWQLYF